jgi:hypothetical protein
VIARGVDRAVVVGGSAVAAVLLAGCVAAAVGGPPYGFVRLALILLVATGAFVLDEPAAAAVDAAPWSRLRRTAARLPALGVPLGVWVAGVGALELRNGATAAGALLVEGVGALALGLALAAGLRLAGRPAPGEWVATILGVGLLGLLVIDPPLPVTPFPDRDGWSASAVLWSLVVVVSAVVVAGASREPYRRSRWSSCGKLSTSSTGTGPS